MSNPLLEPVPALPYIAINRDGDHHLVGSRCGGCGATMLGKRRGCPACGASDSVEAVRLADTGRIRTCTVINRSYPGVPVPFIAAVIDIDGGGVIRGTMKGTIPENPVAEVGKPVTITIEDTGQRDESGRPYFAQVFRPKEFAAC